MISGLPHCPERRPNALCQIHLPTSPLSFRSASFSSASTFHFSYVEINRTACVAAGHVLSRGLPKIRVNFLRVAMEDTKSRGSVANIEF